MIIIRNVTIVNEGKIFSGDVLIKNGRIEKIGNTIKVAGNAIEVNAEGLHLFPGCIDDQVHFREPGLTHKGDLFTESRAAVAGGVTSFMEMPNTVPNALTQDLLEDKYQLGARKSLANYSFFMGVSNDNLEEVLKTNRENVCGIKIFMGSSTGNMLVDNHQVLETIFSESESLIATHCEDEHTIKTNLEIFRQKYGEDILPEHHPLIRNVEACYLSSSYAVGLAKKHNTRLHVLHISTAKETELFDNTIPLEQKRITAEACIHHLWFNDQAYKEKGNLIKWNPAIKTETDRQAVFAAMLDGRIDVIATDHAPHTLEEKAQKYLKAPSGGPLIQHSLIAMLDKYHVGKISLEMIAHKMAHAVAVCFNIVDRGFIREGYHADFVLVNLNQPYQVTKENLLYKCGWSPFMGHAFKSSVVQTYVGGKLVYDRGKVIEAGSGDRMQFKSAN